MCSRAEGRQAKSSPAAPSPSPFTLRWAHGPGELREDGEGAEPRADAVQVGDGRRRRGLGGGRDGAAQLGAGLGDAEGQAPPGLATTRPSARPSSQPSRSRKPAAFLPLLPIPERRRPGCTAPPASAPAAPGCSTYSGSTAPRGRSGGAGGHWGRSAASPPRRGPTGKPLGTEDGSGAPSSARRGRSAVEEAAATATARSSCAITPPAPPAGRTAPSALPVRPEATICARLPAAPPPEGARSARRLPAPLPPRPPGCGDAERGAARSGAALPHPGDSRSAARCAEETRRKPPISPPPRRRSEQPSRGASHLNTAAASATGCRARETAASGTAPSRAAAGTPPKGCETERALLSCWGGGRSGSRSPCRTHRGGDTGGAREALQGSPGKTNSRAAQHPQRVPHPQRLRDPDAARSSYLVPFCWAVGMTL